MSTDYITVTDAPDTAPWLIMVHGMTQDHRVFSSQVVAFKEQYRILLIDLPGHGLSTYVPGPYGHVEMMEHVRRIWDQAAIAPAHFGQRIRVRLLGCYWLSKSQSALGHLF